MAFVGHTNVQVVAAPQAFGGSKSPDPRTGDFRIDWRNSTRQSEIRLRHRRGACLPLIDVGGAERNGPAGKLQGAPALEDVVARWTDRKLRATLGDKLQDAVAVIEDLPALEISDGDERDLDAMSVSHLREDRIDETPIAQAERAPTGLSARTRRIGLDSGMRARSVGDGSQN